MTASFWYFIDDKKGQPVEQLRRLFIQRFVRGYLRREHQSVSFRLRESLVTALETNEPDVVLQTLLSQPTHVANEKKVRMLRDLMTRFASS